MVREARPVSVRLSAIAHATEDTKKVVAAISALGLDATYHSGRPVRGHHGNEIRVLQIESRAPKLVDDFLSSFWRRLSRVDRDEILSNIDKYVNDDGHLHLRVDKQRSLLGELKLEQSEPIKVEIVFDLRGVPNGSATSVVRERLKREDEMGRSGSA